VVAGQSLGALTALRAALEHPEVVGGAIAQSASLWQRDLGAGLAGRRLAGLRAYIEVGTQEWVLREPNRAFARQLAAAGATVEFREYNGGHDYACWRGGIADGLRWMLPPQV
jgi:enterochelin esterase family protein